MKDKVNPDQQLLSIEEAASREAKNKARQTKRKSAKAKIDKEGGLQEYTYAFNFANGKVQAVSSSAKNIADLGLPVLSEKNSLKSQAGQGGKEHTRTVKPVLAKPLRYSLVSRVSKKTGKYTREWKTISIPKSAKVLDILFAINETWGVKPEMVRINGVNILTKQPKNPVIIKAKNKAKFLAKAKKLTPSTAGR